MSKTQFTTNKEKLESTMTRVFDAPRELLWKAHTDPKLVEKWWGPRKYKVIVEKLDPKVNGEWRVINEAEGERYVFYGRYLELKEPEKITWTFTFEPYPDAVIEETVTFEELSEGKTRLTTVSKYPTIEALEGMMSSGMEEGANETWDRLEELVTKS